ncbi:hypothetical protein PAXRUDRAFT_36197 [Paxillus rubicundulus Ve08.2h10]|uniref:Uncharacterized protein n=1 Tax=Paxillus rubicundulus Ve08.2h10 TaxID=930991 RepID=A0A0D0DNY6_9AGAM|nr:hypothetical protein PAXRUDRAFT_36197 [Paxillus rubicundulus Ve08.2h10]
MSQKDQNKSGGVKIILVAVVCDKPAAHKICSFVSHSHTNFYTVFWFLSRQLIKDKDKPKAFEKGAFQLRTNEEQCKLGEQYCQLTLLTACKNFSSQFIVPGSCGKLPTDIGMPSRGSLTADQWLLVSTVYGPIVIPQLWSASLPQDIDPEILHQHVIMIQKLESKRQEQANYKANYKKALEEAKKLGKEAHEAEKAPCDELPDETNPPENNEAIPEAGKEGGKVSLHCDDPVTFLKLCMALQILIICKLTDTNVDMADNLICKYDLGLITLYGSAVIKPDNHFATHVGACSCNFGPLHNFWMFLFKWLNKVLKSYKTNNHLNVQIDFKIFSLKHYPAELLPFQASQIMLKASNEECGSISGLATLSQELDNVN